jgi:hypothetical protein
MNGSFWMSAPGFSCSGRYDTSATSSIELPINCNDGRAGTASLSNAASASGHGRYRLSDGSEGTIAFADLSSKAIGVLENTAQTSPAIVRSADSILDDDRVKTVISASRSNYPGNCPCPYDRDTAGKRCGKRSAYSRAGGYSVKCYAADVTSADIAATK